MCREAVRLIRGNFSEASLEGQAKRVLYLFLTGVYFQYVIGGAVQYQAECFKCVDGHAFIFAQGIQCAGAESIFLDELILGNAFVFQCIPKRVVVEHSISPEIFVSVYSYIFLLHIAEYSAIMGDIVVYSMKRI